MDPIDLLHIQCIRCQKDISSTLMNEPEEVICDWCLQTENNSRLHFEIQIYEKTIKNMGTQLHAQNINNQHQTEDQFSMAQFELKYLTKKEELIQLQAQQQQQSRLLLKLLMKRQELQQQQSKQEKLLQRQQIRLSNLIEESRQMQYQTQELQQYYDQLMTLTFDKANSDTARNNP